MWRVKKISHNFVRQIRARCEFFESLAGDFTRSIIDKESLEKKIKFRTFSVHLQEIAFRFYHCDFLLKNYLYEHEVE